VFKKEYIYYSVSAGVIALIAQLAGASLPVTIFTSLLIPPAILLLIRIIRRWLTFYETGQYLHLWLVISGYLNLSEDVSLNRF
jgi:hypothetical protein